jgi:hypothetical protein
MDRRAFGNSDPSSIFNLSPNVASVVYCRVRCSLDTWFP